MNLLKFPIDSDTEEDRLAGALGHFLAVHYEVDGISALPCAINMMSIVQCAIENGVPTAIEKMRQELVDHNLWVDKHHPSFKKYNLENFDYWAKGAVGGRKQSN